jgi:hypothetical protein
MPPVGSKSLDVGVDMGNKIAEYMVEHSLKPSQ